jgi:hypothetical protein
VGATGSASAGDGYDTQPKSPISHYFGVFGGIDIRDDQNLNGQTPGGAVRDIVVDYDNGWVFGANIGIAGRDYAWGRVRGEVEFAFRKADVGALALNGVDRVVQDGSETTVTTGLVNAYYDSPLLYDRLRLSVGAGFGIANINHGINYLVANAAAIGTIPGQLQIALPSSETTYAWQLIGAAEVKINETLSFVGDVRYLSINDVQVERYVGNSIINGVATTQGTLDSILKTDLQSVTVTGGLRVTF